MSDQECALYGDLIRHLGDECVTRIAQLDPTHPADAAKKWIDNVVRLWIFTPDKDMHESTPRDFIWRERHGEVNIVDDDHQHVQIFEDYPVCQTIKEFEGAGEWHWHYDGGGYSLIAEHDPEGWDALWKEDEE